MVPSIRVVPKIRGTFFGGPHDKDYSIPGSMFGSACYGKLPYIGFVLHPHPPIMDGQMDFLS